MAMTLRTLSSAMLTRSETLAARSRGGSRSVLISSELWYALISSVMSVDCSGVSGTVCEDAASFTLIVSTCFSISRSSLDTPSSSSSSSVLASPAMGHWVKVKNVKADIALYGNPISELLDVTCHVGLHSVTCHPTQVNAPPPNPSHAGWYSIYVPRRDGRLS